MRNTIYITTLFVLIAFNTPAQEADSISSEKNTILIDSSLIKSTNESSKDSLNKTIVVSQDNSKPKDKACSCLWQSILTILAPIIGIFGSLLLFYLKLKSDKKKELAELARRQAEEADKNT